MPERPIPRTIKFVAKYLEDLSNTKPVAEWAVDHIERIEHILYSYENLISTVNSVSNCSPLLEAMPNIKRLKATLKGKGLPRFAEMSQGNFALGLREAKCPMLYGQKNKYSDPTTLTHEDISYAIATPSMDTSPEALAVGMIGHLGERTFFQWARKNGYIPKGGWKKDYLLQALNESLMLKLTRGEKPYLSHFFLEPNTKGGLGWLNKDKLNTFKTRVREIQQNGDYFTNTQ